MIASKTAKSDSIPQDIQKYINLYIGSKRLKGTLESSLVRYRERLESLGAFLTILERLAMSEVTMDDVTEYYTRYTQDRNKPLSSKTVAHAHTIMTDFLEWTVHRLTKQGIGKLTYADIAEFKEFRPKVRFTIKPVAWAKLRKLLTKLSDTKEPPPNLTRQQTLLWWRRSAIYLTMYCTALRVSEVCSLNKADLRKAQVIVVTKGHKDHETYFSESALYFCRHYVSLREDNDPALFVIHDRANVTKRIRPKVVQELMDQENITGLSPHQIRRLSATDYYNATKDLQAVQSMLGHSNVATTIKYITNDNVLNKEKMWANHPAYAKTRQSYTDTVIVPVDDDCNGDGDNE